ncbi:MAG: ABC transporter ATP-binding protein [Chloroflexi bacterium]|nr:ABC transporter ATP-binding protein [Chloroflexota bacterium]
MNEIAIRAENLSKAYHLTHQVGQVRYKTLREDLLALPRRLGSIARGPASSIETFWALKDVSFDIHEGTVVGIIGRNGAGKSTLLKILSRITEPTRGRAEIYGRVGSLLEVGTGFHAELTGRENIFLSGAVSGMTRAEVQRKFDEIVAFAEVERFLDTPAKHYSSGMYVRLAFAVAAHLEPEILIIDEVLAVGDAQFQKKCLGKIGEVAKTGRTVLFVSHNMAAVQNLCESGIVLDTGRIVFAGPIEPAIRFYLEEKTAAPREAELRDRRDRTGTQTLRFTEVRILGTDGNELATVLSGQDIVVRFYYESQQELNNANVNIAFNLYNPQGVVITNLNSKDVGRLRLPIAKSGWFECVWPKFSLRAGIYTCALFCEVNGEIVDWLQSAFQIRVEEGDFFGTGSIIQRGQGEILVTYDWRSSGEHPVA